MQWKLAPVSFIRGRPPLKGKTFYSQIKFIFKEKFWLKKSLDSQVIEMFEILLSNARKYQRKKEKNGHGCHSNNNNVGNNFF